MAEIKNSFGGFDKSGHIKCNKCGELTNGYYIRVPDLCCWKCDAPLLGSHVETILYLHNLIKASKAEIITPDDLKQKISKLQLPVKVQKYRRYSHGFNKAIEMVIKLIADK